MIGLDTNILVRYLAQDEPAQAKAAAHLIDQQLSARNPGFVSVLVLAEICWVLERQYGATQQDQVRALWGLLAQPQLQVQHRDEVLAALELVQSQGLRVDLPDALIAQLAVGAGCSHTFTFDQKAAKRAGMRLLAAGAA